MENDKTNIKVERISLLLARINRKMGGGGMPNLIATRRSTATVRKFTKSPYTSLKLDKFRVFNKLFRVDDKGLALQSYSIKKAECFRSYVKVHVEK